MYNANIQITSEIKSNYANIIRHFAYPDLEQVESCFTSHFVFTLDLHSIINASQYVPLKDGIIGLISLINQIKKENLQVNSKFVIPACLSPVIPIEFQNLFEYYQFNSQKNFNKSKAIFLNYSGIRRPQEFESCIKNIKLAYEYSKNIYIIHPLFDIVGLNSFLGDSNSIEDINLFKDELKKRFPKANISIISFHEFKKLISKDSIVIDTNQAMLLYNQSTVIEIARQYGAIILESNISINFFDQVKYTDISPCTTLLLSNYKGACLLDAFEEYLFGSFESDFWTFPENKQLIIPREILTFSKYLSKKLIHFYEDES